MYDSSRRENWNMGATIKSPTIRAIDLMIVLAKSDGPLPAAELTGGLNQQDASEAIHPLKIGGVIRVAGRAGAKLTYELARPAERISLLDIINAAQGGLNSWMATKPVARPEVAAAFDRASEALRRSLRRSKLSDLAGRQVCAEQRR
jgi:DNA-binding IscR family transcriptional regulator